MPYARDPLSVRFDRQVRVVLGLAIEQHRKHVKNRRLVPYVRVIVPNFPGELLRDEGGLSKSERAFQRSLYHDERIHKPRKTSTGEWSLKCEWDDPPLLPGGNRILRITVFPPAEASRYAKKRPASEQWTRNARMQSGGEGSPKNRFPSEITG